MKRFHISTGESAIGLATSLLGCEHTVSTFYFSFWYLGVSFTTWLWHGALAMWNSNLRMALCDQLGRQSFSSSSSSSTTSVSQLNRHTSSQCLSRPGSGAIWENGFWQLPCSFCGKHFSSPQALGIHNRRSHS